MKRIIINSILIAGLAVQGGVIFAQGVPSAVQNVRERAMEKKDAVIERTMEKKNAVTDRMMEKKDNLMERKQAITEKKTEFMDQMTAKREAMKTTIETRKTELKAKLVKIKDERKKQLVEKLDNRFTEINQKMTNGWEQYMDRLSDLLAKVVSRADKAVTAGKDVTKTRTAITAAETAIETARQTIAAQLAKTYPISVTTDDALRSAVASTRTTLNTDLQAVREKIRAAHKAVVDALTSLKGIAGVDQVTEPSTTSTAQ